MILRSPVPIDELLALYTAGGRLKPIEASAAILQGARSESAGWYRGDEIAAAVLLYPVDSLDGSDTREVLFIARGPGLPLVPIVRYARLMAAALPDDVRLTVQARTFAGERLARLCGFTAAGGDRWEWSASARGACPVRAGSKAQWRNSRTA